MKRLALFVAITAPFVFHACLGSDPIAATDLENSRTTCTDGLDNDGDGNFDCYDAECYALDKSLRAKGDSICRYQDYDPIFIPSSSSDEDASSSSASNLSSGAASSSATNASSSSAGFPFSYYAYADDTTKILGLFRKAGTNEIHFMGQLSENGFYGKVDTTGVEIGEPQEVQSHLFPEAFFVKFPEYETWTPTGRLLRGAYISPSENFIAYGHTKYAQGNFATRRTSIGGSIYNQFWIGEMPNSEFVFLDIVSGNSECIALNQNDTAFGQVDSSMADINILQSFPFMVYPASMAAGEVYSEKCSMIANRTTADSTQIWFGRLLKTRSLDVKTHLLVGNSEAQGFDLTTVGSMTYVAATVGTYPRMLVLDNSGVVTDNGTTQGLGSGTPRAIRAIQVGADTRLLMVGESNGQGAAWLLNINGEKISGPTLFSGASSFSDVLQLGNGDLVVSGWKSNVPAGNGFSAVILRMGSDLQIK